MSYHFDLIIKNIFFDIIKNEKLKVTLIDEQIVTLKSEIKEFSVEFVMSRDGVDILYVIPMNNKDEIKYNIGEFISEKISAEDRLHIDLHYETFLDKIIIELKILNNTFNRLGGVIFSTENHWFKEYQKSPYFVESRIIER